MSKKNKLQALINQRLKQLTQESATNQNIAPKTHSGKVIKPQREIIKGKPAVEEHETINKDFKESKYLSRDLIKIAIIIAIVIVIAIIIYIFRDSSFMKNISNSIFGAFNRS